MNVNFNKDKKKSLNTEKNMFFFYINGAIIKIYKQ